MIYQIQRKFRDEARPRAGMIRVREFTMKDAYSFHTSQEDLDAYYQKCYNAYVVAFVRGDYEVNETKLRNLVGEEIHPAEITEDSPLVADILGLTIFQSK